MGIVTWMVNSATDTLDTVASSTFGAVAAATGGIIASGATIVLAVSFANFAFQTRAMDARSFIGLAVKLVLIAIFALDWTQFSAISTAIIAGLDSLAAALMAGIGLPGPSGAIGFAEALDRLMDQFADYLNASVESFVWYTGAFFGAMGVAMLSGIAAICGAILIYAKIMLTFFIGLAPIMIATALFDFSKDYFHRWLSSLVSYALYPVVIAGVLSVVLRMATEMLAKLGDPYEAGSIGLLLPFFAMIFVTAGLVLSIPVIVRALSGNFMFVAAPAMAGPAAQQARLGMAGLFNTRASRARAAAGQRGVIETVTDTLNAGFRANVSGAIRMTEAMERNRRIEASRGADGPGRPSSAPAGRPAKGATPG